VSVFKAELTKQDNVKNTKLALQELKDLNVPVTLGHVGFGPKEEREMVLILPENHSHMKDSLLTVYKQTTYLKCDSDGMCSVVSLTPEGEASTQLGDLKEGRLMSDNDYTLLVNGKHYYIGGLV
jgi:hypothetical protein